MIIDGTVLARALLARTKVRAKQLLHPPEILAVVANETPATRSYLAIKERRARAAGCRLVVERFPESASTEELQAAITHSAADSIIVQLPLPPSASSRAVCSVIPLAKDADVLSADARARFDRGESDALLPPVVAAVKEILEQGAVELAGKRAVVIGTGWLVGAPAATWLTQQGARVQTFSYGEDPSSALSEADIIVSGAGSPHLIKPEMIKQGVVLIDAGTSESGGAIVGDADPACASKCSLFTPVPGGVGPIAVAKLFENAVLLAERK